MILSFASYGTQRMDEHMNNCVLECDIMNITLAKLKMSRKEQAVEHACQRVQVLVQ